MRPESNKRGEPPAGPNHRTTWLARGPALSSYPRAAADSGIATHEEPPERRAWPGFWPKAGPFRPAVPEMPLTLESDKAGSI